MSGKPSLPRSVRLPIRRVLLPHSLKNLANKLSATTASGFTISNKPTRCMAFWIPRPRSRHSSSPQFSRLEECRWFTQAVQPMAAPSSRHGGISELHPSVCRYAGDAEFPSEDRWDRCRDPTCRPPKPPLRHVRREYPFIAIQLRTHEPGAKEKQKDEGVAEKSEVVCRQRFMERHERRSVACGSVWASSDGSDIKSMN